MKCSNIECCQNDHLLFLCIPMQYVGPLNPFWGGNGKIRFPNSRISLVYTDMYYRFLLTNFYYLINVIFFNHKRKISPLYKIISINVSY